MKMKLVLLPILFILSLSLAMASTCYQENADDATSCSGTDVGTYATSGRFNKSQTIANFTDGNWNSFLKSNDTAKQTPVYVYANWYKPQGATVSSKWMAKVNSTPVSANYTITQSCWDYDNFYVHFRITGANSTAGKKTMTLACQNGAASYSTLGSFIITTAATEPRFYEDAMYWSIDDQLAQRDTACASIFNQTLSAFQLAAIALIVLIAAMIISALAGVTDIKSTLVIAIVSSITIVLSVYVLSLVSQSICG